MVDEYTLKILEKIQILDKKDFLGILNERQKEEKSSIDKILEMDVNCISDNEFQENHPSLGNLTNPDHLFNTPSLFENTEINLKEPHYTKTLGKFLKKEQSICHIFVETIYETVKKEIEKNTFIPDKNNKILSFYEELTDQVENDEDKKKRIDNVLLWSNNNKTCGIIFEIKLDGKVQNKLKVYKEHIQNQYGIKEQDFKKNFLCIILSIEQKKFDEQKIWENILWKDLLFNFNNKLLKTATPISTDFKRFLSAIWHRIL